MKNKSQWKYSLNKNVCNLPKTASVVQLYVPLMSLIAEACFWLSALVHNKDKMLLGHKNKDIHFQYLWAHYFSV